MHILINLTDKITIYIKKHGNILSFCIYSMLYVISRCRWILDFGWHYHNTWTRTQVTRVNSSQNPTRVRTFLIRVLTRVDSSYTRLECPTRVDSSWLECLTRVDFSYARLECWLELTRVMPDSSVYLC